MQRQPSLTSVTRALGLLRPGALSPSLPSTGGTSGAHGGAEDPTSVVISRTTMEDEVQIQQYLRRYNRKQLQEMCRTANKPDHGTKFELVKRLIGTASQESIVRRRNSIDVYENDHHVWIHPESQFVFHPESHVVIGTWNGNSVLDLTHDDIQQCHCLKLRYQLPECLPDRPEWLAAKKKEEAVSSTSHNMEEEEEDGSSDQEEDNDDVFA